MADFAALRRTMVDTQVRPSDVTDLPLIHAMLETPREVFIPQASAGLAYLDLDLPVGNGRRMLTPMVLAKMIQALNIDPQDRVLDIGCATGYAAAILSQLAASVVAVEEDEGLVRAARTTLAQTANVEVVLGRLVDGYRNSAPYEAILVEGCVEIEPDQICQQLADGGRLVCISGTGPATKATLYTRDLGDITRQTIFDAFGPPLPGFAKPAAFVF